MEQINKRKWKPRSRYRPVNITVRLTHAERDILRQKAQAAGVALSEFVRLSTGVTQTMMAEGGSNE